MLQGFEPDHQEFCSRKPLHASGRRQKKTPRVLTGSARKTHGAAENLRDPEGSHTNYWLKAFERSTGIAW